MTELNRWRVVVAFCFGLLPGPDLAGVFREIGFVAGRIADPTSRGARV